MILVTLGTQDKPFTRLLDVIQEEIDCGNINDRVVVQAGYTKYKSDDMEIFDLIDRDRFSELIKNCDILITHGGVGSILTGITNNKKVIVCPRLSCYGEHMNDHQLQIVNNFYDMGYILKYCDGDNFSDVMNSVKNFVPKKYKSNNKKFVSVIENYINNN